jgi:hypothetical protein
MWQSSEVKLFDVFFTRKPGARPSVRQRCSSKHLVLKQRLACILYGLHGTFEIEGPAEGDLKRGEKGAGR